MAGLRSGARAWLGLAALLPVLALGAACGPSDAFHRTQAATGPAEQGLPFHPGDEASASDGAAPAVAPDTKVGGLPFHGAHARVVPPGTLLTVELEDTLSSQKVQSGDAFAASVAAPLVVDGDTAIGRGAAVTGHVESASQTDIPGMKPGSGFFRLSLSSVTLGGRSVALETSSLYARGVVVHSNTISVPRGRHLTFRLTAPVTIEDPKAVASR